MEMSSPRLAYEIPYLAQLVNSFPRFDLSLRRVNATFLPDSHDYKEVMSQAHASIASYKAQGHVPPQLPTIFSQLTSEPHKVHSIPLTSGVNRNYHLGV